MPGGTSLVRFMNDRGGGDDRGRYFWHRAGEDGAPFRGHSAPMFREEEYENRAVKVGDPKVRIFNVSEPTERVEYQNVLAKVVNGGWGQVLHVDRQYDATKNCWLVYLEWVEWFMEDGSPEAAQTPRMEPINGQQHGQPIQAPQPGYAAG